MFNSREDYDKLSQFVSEKKLRVKSMVKVMDHTRSYKDDGSSDSDHDAYLERMIAEGEDRDSEDGMYLYNVLSHKVTVPYCHLMGQARKASAGRLGGYRVRYQYSYYYSRGK